MLASIMQKVYIDAEWVAKEYLCRCKQNKWNIRRKTQKPFGAGIWSVLLMQRLIKNRFQMN
jgi:hypothetical protein